jgi:hypothetical protein
MLQTTEHQECQGCYWQGSKFYRNGHRRRSEHTCDLHTQLYDKPWRYNIGSRKLNKIILKREIKNPIPPSIILAIEDYLGIQDIMKVYDFWCGVEGSKFILITSIANINGLTANVRYVIYEKLRNITKP